MKLIKGKKLNELSAEEAIEFLRMVQDGEAEARIVGGVAICYVRNDFSNKEATTLRGILTPFRKDRKLWYVPFASYLADDDDKVKIVVRLRGAESKSKSFDNYADAVKFRYQLEDLKWKPIIEKAIERGWIKKMPKYKELWQFKTYDEVVTYIRKKYHYYHPEILEEMKNDTM